MKVSPTMLRGLDAIDNGQVRIARHRDHGYDHLVGPVNGGTLKALRRRGLIELNQLRRMWVLTDAGRRELAASEMDD